MSLSIYLLLVVACVVNAQRSDDLRLIEFNETYRVWMPFWKVEELAECGKGHQGFMDITDIKLTPNDLSAQVKSVLPTAYPNGPTHQTIVNGLIPLLSKDKMREYTDKLSAYHTRYYTTTTGKESAEWIYREMTTQKGSRTDITVKYFPHSWLQPSVIARIQGSGPNANEVVIIGAHEDSINGGATKRAPGADDDASGTCTVMELFRVLSTSGFKPDRSLEFHTYAAEEVGLRGSQDIASSYQKTNVPVYSMMQLDMTFYIGGKTATFGLYSDYVNSDLTRFVGTLVPVYSNLKVTKTSCGYACSDHASWNKAGFPACYPAEGIIEDDNRNIHTDKDTISILNLDHGLQFAKVGLGYLVELGLTN